MLVKISDSFVFLGVFKSIPALKFEKLVIQLTNEFDVSTTLYFGISTFIFVGL